jgi:hypothetical protein
VQRKDGHGAVINDVLYVPKMKSSLISLGQLLEKNYSMKMENKIEKTHSEGTII